MSEVQNNERFVLLCKAMLAFKQLAEVPEGSYWPHASRMANVYEAKINKLLAELGVD